MVSPTLEAKVPHPVRAVAAPVARPMVQVHARTAVPVQNPVQTPAPHPQPVAPVARGPQRTLTTTNQPPRPVEPRPLIGRTPPPPQGPSFEQRQQAMQAHPGRPLEPQQIENLRQGRPAGQMQDREWPPHPQPMARPEARPQPPRR